MFCCVWKIPSQRWEDFHKAMHHDNRGIHLLKVLRRFIRSSQNTTTKNNNQPIEGRRKASTCGRFCFVEWWCDRGVGDIEILVLLSCHTKIPSNRRIIKHKSNIYFKRTIHNFINYLLRSLLSISVICIEQITDKFS